MNSRYDMLHVYQTNSDKKINTDLHKIYVFLQMEPSVNRCAQKKPCTLGKTASPMYIRHFLLTAVQMISLPWGACDKLVWTVKRWQWVPVNDFLWCLLIVGLPEYEVFKSFWDLDVFFWTIRFFRHSYHASQFHEESLEWFHVDMTQAKIWYLMTISKRK